MLCDWARGSFLRGTLPYNGVNSGLTVKPLINNAILTHKLEVKQHQRKPYRLSIVWNTVKCLRNEKKKGSRKSMLFSQISAFVKATAVGNPVTECAYGLFSSPYTLSKCNGCLTSMCLVFKRCPRHWCQTSYWVISHQCLPCDRMGSSWDTQHCQKTKPWRQSVKSRAVQSCLTCKFHVHPLFILQFYLHSMRDGIFGEGLCFLQLNSPWNNVHFHLYQTYMQTHICFCASCRRDHCCLSSQGKILMQKL